MIQTGNMQAIDITDLREIAEEILDDNGLSYIPTIQVNDSRAGGFAAINYNYSTNYVQIYVDSGMLRSQSSNTWAFVLGHEFGHKYLRSGGSPKAEWDADIKGAGWATRSGYSIRSYISKLLNDPNSCGPTHGCWHSRAHNLARRYGIQINGSDLDDHKSHKTAKGPFPSEDGSRCLRRSTSESKPTSTTQVKAIKVRCSHYVQCSHYVYNGYNYQQLHSYDIQHQYDIQYVRTN